MILGFLVLVLGAVLALIGHRTGRLQLRAIGAGLAAFGVVTGLLSAVG